MFKRIYKLIYIIIAILIITLVYLSFIGIKTTAFNNVLENKIKEIDQRLSISLKQVYLKINLKNIQVPQSALKKLLIQLRLEVLTGIIFFPSNLLRENAIIEA